MDAERIQQRFEELPASSFEPHHRSEGFIQTTTFTWPELKKGCCAPPYNGDCHQIEGTLTLQSDGKAHFSCVTWTDQTHSGDHWWAGFQLLDHSGVTLHTQPYHQGPRMDDGNPPPRYRWSFDFTFDPAIYGQVTQARQSFKC